MLATFLNICAAILPVMILMGVGWWLRQLNFLDEHSCGHIGKIMFWFLLPALIIYKFIERDDVVFTGLDDLIYISLILTVMWALIAAGISWKYYGAYQMGSVISMAVRSNVMFVGLYVMYGLIDQGVVSDASMMSFLVIGAVIIPIYNVISVLGFIPAGAQTGDSLRTQIMRMFTKTISNPLIIACVLGIIGAVVGIKHDHIPGPLWLCLTTLGDGALPMAVLITGASLDLKKMQTDRWPLVLGVSIKLFLLPFTVLLWGYFAGLSHDDTIVLVVITSASTAVAALPMAQAMGADDKLMAAGIIASTIFMPPFQLALIFAASALY